MTIFDHRVSPKDMILNHHALASPTHLQALSDIYNSHIKAALISSIKKIFQGEMLIRTLPTTLLQIFCIIFFNS